MQQHWGLSLPQLRCLAGLLQAGEGLAINPYLQHQHLTHHASLVSLCAGKDAHGKLDKVTKQVWDDMVAHCQVTHCRGSSQRWYDQLTKGGNIDKWTWSNPDDAAESEQPILLYKRKVVVPNDKWHDVVMRCHEQLQPALRNNISLPQVTQALLDQVETDQYCIDGRH